jgi:hypothetical protein
VRVETVTLLRRRNIFSPLLDLLPAAASIFFSLSLSDSLSLSFSYFFDSELILNGSCVVFFLAYQWLCCVVINYNLLNKFTVCDLVCVGLSMKNGPRLLCSLCLKKKKKKKLDSVVFV